MKARIFKIKFIIFNVVLNGLFGFVWKSCFRAFPMITWSRVVGLVRGDGGAYGDEWKNGGRWPRPRWRQWFGFEVFNPSYTELG